MRLLFVILAFLTSIDTLALDRRLAAVIEPCPWWAHFQLGANMTLSGSNHSVAPQGSWNPILSLGHLHPVGDIFTRGNFAISGIKRQGKFNIAITYEVLFGLSIDSGIVELGGGYQTEVSKTNGGSFPIASINLAYPFSVYEGFALERLYVGYSLSLYKNTIEHMVRIGIGLHF